ncbi:hypothetical protein SUDANB121_04021 [Nocardiopsis dassonvillei]|uniref:carboxypeptidase-like regulatory domain-containing protein n=1 Tax=Nocardiopsis dassonvillei TaxID=2014 RepID=UPI003F570123
MVRNPSFRSLSTAAAAGTAMAVLLATGCGTRGTGTVSGTVTDTSGAPIAGCGMVPEVTSHPAPAMTEMGYTTSEDGGYTIPLPAATYTLTAYCFDGREGADGTRSVRDLAVREGGELVVDFEFPQVPESDPHTPVSPSGRGSPPGTGSPHPPTLIPGIPPQRTPPSASTAPDDPSGS